MKSRPILLCLLMSIGIAACAPSAGQPIPAISPQVAPPQSPSPTPDCQPAAGVTMEVRRSGSTKAMLQASGLEPGEVPVVFYSTVGIHGNSERVEAWNFAHGADQQGRFSFEMLGLTPPEGQPSATWDVRLVHRRGVACAQITLP